MHAMLTANVLAGHAPVQHAARKAFMVKARNTAQEMADKGHTGHVATC